MFFKSKLKLLLVGFCVIVIIGIACGVLFIRQQYIVPILMYHSVSATTPDEDNLLAVSSSTFERQMKFLRKRNYNVISILELSKLLKNNSNIPRNTVVVTFDDGYEDNFTLAFPILEKYSIPATIFVAPLDISTEEQYLTWPEVKKLSDSALIDIGSHTLNQAYLPDIEDKAELISQIKTSKTILEEILKTPVEAFSYPAGGFNMKIRQIVIDSGYECAVVTKPGLKYPDNDLFALKRIRISEHNKNMFIFWTKLTGLYLPLREWQRRDKDKAIFERINEE